MQKSFLSATAVAAVLAATVAAGTVLTLSSSVAAELPVKAATPAKASVFDWSGFYAGAQAGYAWSDVDWGFAPPGGRFHLDPAGAFAGGHLGYNRQAGNWVYGLVADINAADIAQSINPAFDFVISARLRWFGSARARMGIARDHWLAYVTGGYAFGLFENSFNSPVVIGAQGGFNEVRHGWTAGAGLEYAFSSTFMTRVEYRYADYGKRSYQVVGLGAPHTADLTTHQVQFGVSYRFGSR